jgi:hypothetical protein
VLSVVLHAFRHLRPQAGARSNAQLHLNPDRRTAAADHLAVQRWHGGDRHEPSGLVDLASVTVAVFSISE